MATRNELYSWAGFGSYASIVLPDPDGALDSDAEYQQWLTEHKAKAETTQNQQ